jgi:hypothetical protein
MVELVLHQLRQVGRQVAPAARAASLVLVLEVDAAVPAHAHAPARHAEAVVPDLDGLGAAPHDPRVDEGERRGAQVRDDDPRREAGLRCGHRPSEAVPRAEVGERRVQPAQRRGQRRIGEDDRRRDLGEARVVVGQDRERGVVRRVHRVLIGGR